MAISDKQLEKIKNIIQDFVDDIAFTKMEDDVQTSYTIPVLLELGWKPSIWKINTGQDIKTGKRPDILLKGSGGGTIFVIESKEPSVKNGLDGRYPKWTFEEQTCFYCGSEGVSWGALTNFVEWRIYNPHSFRTNGTYYRKLIIIKDKKIVCTDEQLREFFSLINYAFIDSCKGKISKETVYYKKEFEIKEEFFQNLKGWRNSLRKHIFKNYNSLTPEQVDYNTQKILDRLIFMDVCYDKGIISQDILGSILFSGKPFYYELKKKFREFDDKYNSELFAIEECDKFDIPNAEIEDIIKGINHTDFLNISVHIIGEVYENYLGELLKAGKQSLTTTSENKEHLKRKSQGIYYTPDYIVNYIVNSTVGALLKECKTVKDIEKIKVIDISCGSGSFLIRAFEFFYEAYKSKKEHRSSDIFNELDIRKKILLHNLFGVDLDERAVEIAKLNLLLRALDGLQDLDTNMKERKILPNLSLNIRCGNSLVSGKYQEETVDDNKKQLSFMFDKNSEYSENIKKLLELKKEFYEEEDNLRKDKLIEKVYTQEEIINKYLNESLKEYFKDIQKIKPFNYDVAYCEVMKSGGFDCIIGNPPFVQLSMEKDFSQGYKNYLFNEYESSMGRFNTFGFFVKRSILLIKNKGLSGLIIPNTILTQDYYKELRSYILDNTSINSIVNYEKMPFKDAVVENITFITEKEIKKNNKISLIDYSEEGEIKEIIINQNIYKNTYSNQFTKISNKGNFEIKNQIIKNKYFLLGDITNINQAIALKYDRAKYLFESKVDENYKPVLDGRNIDRYKLNWSKKYLKYDINAIHSCKETDIFECKEKLFFRRVGATIKATYDNKKHYALNTLVVITLKENHKYSLKFILGILNSKLMNFYYITFLKSTKKVFSEIQARQIKQLPILKINFQNNSEKVQHDKLVLLVNEMLELNKNYEKNKTKIIATDEEIDMLVYKNYNISETEQRAIDKALEKK